jgi:hypothetical protein
LKDIIKKYKNFDKKTKKNYKKLKERERKIKLKSLLLSLKKPKSETFDLKDKIKNHKNFVKTLSL